MNKLLALACPPFRAHTRDVAQGFMEGLNALPVHLSASDHGHGLRGSRAGRCRSWCWSPSAWQSSTLRDWWRLHARLEPSPAPHPRWDRALLQRRMSLRACTCHCRQKQLPERVRVEPNSQAADPEDEVAAQDRGCSKNWCGRRKPLKQWSVIGCVFRSN